MTYDIEQGLSTLYIAPITAQGVIWFGRGSTLEEAEDRLVKCFPRFSRRLMASEPDMTSMPSKFTTSMPTDIEHWLVAHHQKKVYVLRESQNMKGLLPDFLKPNYDTHSLLLALDASRVIKGDDEIDLIRRAIKVSSLAHRTVVHHITSMESEAEVHAHGADWQAYPPIVASGANASILHYTDNNGSLKGKDNADPEVFAQSHIPACGNGWPSKEVAETYAIVEEMQERCIAMLGPGVRYLDAFYLADRIAIEGLMRLGILRKGNIEKLLRSAVSKAFFPHGLGHHMGLDVHDVSAKPILSFCGGEEQSMIEFSEKSPLRLTNEFMAPCTSDAAPWQPGTVITREADLELQLSLVTPWKQYTYPTQKFRSSSTKRYWNGTCMLEESE
ncbi:hypothetical protein HO133_006496 [Letharia lupina]|uniref:Xaa-Pro aminopeptidase n=1 Tax=Letharia lupina TaxID=560253 RepID=A0A8H6C758_9LECA|nr:uncharacterized protein HO133_006496 [Letharia lupina]KAF6218084.1 hypothetical protein HO133_006496 [Letharia lupina]